jgi:hypothetical protein
MADLDAIMARLERLEGLEAENGALRERLRELNNLRPAADSEPEQPLSRRGLLRRAGAGAAVLGAAAAGASIAPFVRPSSAIAADGDAVTVGGSFVATHVTAIANSANSDDVLHAFSRAGTGIDGVSESANGVHGSSQTGTGVRGDSNFGVAVVGESPNGRGVAGRSFGSGEGVSGRSVSGTGVVGLSASGRGVSGESDASDGVFGQSHMPGGVGVRGEVEKVNGIAVFGSSREPTTETYGVIGLAVSPAGIGVLGSAGDTTGGTGAFGEAKGAAGVGVRGVARAGGPGPSLRFGTGVIGSSGSESNPRSPARANTGVLGVGTNGRGGVFIGDRAQAQLVASSASTHPATGLRGDLFVDKAGRLWFCKSGRTWKQLA